MGSSENRWRFALTAFDPQRRGAHQGRDGEEHEDLAEIPLGGEHERADASATDCTQPTDTGRPTHPGGTNLGGVESGGQRVATDVHAIEEVAQ